MSILDSFELYTDQKTPFISVVKNGLILSEETRRLLGNTTHVKIWKRSETRQLAITAARPGEIGAERISTRFWRIDGAVFRKAAEELMGVKFAGKACRISGTFIPEENLMLFDMSRWYVSPMTHGNR